MIILGSMLGLFKKDNIIFEHFLPFISKPNHILIQLRGGSSADGVKLSCGVLEMLPKPVWH